MNRYYVYILLFSADSFRGKYTFNYKMQERNDSPGTKIILCTKKYSILNTQYQYPILISAKPFSSWQQTLPISIHKNKHHWRNYCR